MYGLPKVVLGLEVEHHMTLPIEHAVSALHACTSSLRSIQIRPLLPLSRTPQMRRGLSSLSRLSAEGAAAAHLLLLLLL